MRKHTGEIRKKEKRKDKYVFSLYSQFLTYSMIYHKQKMQKEKCRWQHSVQSTGRRDRADLNDQTFVGKTTLPTIRFRTQMLKMFERLSTGVRAVDELFLRFAMRFADGRLIELAVRVIGETRATLVTCVNDRLTILQKVIERAVASQRIVVDVNRRTRELIQRTRMERFEGVRTQMQMERRFEPVKSTEVEIGQSVLTCNEINEKQ